MQHVLADRVAPGHVAPAPAEGVALVEEVVLAFVVDHPIGVVVPAARRREMKLRAMPLRVVRVEVLGRVASGDTVEHVGVVASSLLGGEHEGFAAEIMCLKVDPEIRLARREFDYEFPERRAFPFEPEEVRGGSHLDGKVEVVLYDLDLAAEIFSLHREAPVAQNYIVNRDVPPSSDSIIDDLDPGVEALVIGDIPAFPLQCLGSSKRSIGTSRGAYGPGPAVSKQDEVDGDILAVCATADEEIDVVALDLECGRDEFARALVAAHERIGERLAIVARHGRLVRQRTVCRRVAEGLALDFPAAVAATLEIGDNNVVLGMAGRREKGHA